MKLLGTQSFGKGVISSTILNVFAKGLQFANTILIAYFFGANSTTDLYYFIIATSLLISALINSLDGVVLIPEFIKLKETESKKSAFSFLNFYFYTYIVIGFSIALISLFANSNQLSFIFNLPFEIIKGNLVFIKVACFLPLLILVTNLLSATANANNFFSVPVIISLINSVVILIITILFHKTLGVMSGVIAFVVGYSINIFILLFLFIHKLNWNFTIINVKISYHIKTTILVSYLTTLPITLRNYMVNYLFNGLGGGLLTAVSWGQQLAALPDVFITNQIVNITSIKFSEYFSKKQTIKAYELLYKISEYLFIILLVCMFISIIYSKEIISIILSRGSFTKEKAHVTASIFALLSALPVISIFSIIIGRLFIAFQKLSKTTFITTLSHIAIFVILYFTIKNYGVVGFGVASIVGYCIPTILFIIIAPKNFVGLNLSIVLKNLLKPVIILTFLSITLFVIHHLLKDNNYKFLSFILGTLMIITTVLLLYKKTIFTLFKKGLN